MEMPKMKEIIRVGVDEKGGVVVYGDLGNKRLCLFVLTEAIRTVFEYNPPKIVSPEFKIVKPSQN